MNLLRLIIITIAQRRAAIVFSPIRIRWSKGQQPWKSYWKHYENGSETLFGAHNPYRFACAPIIDRTAARSSVGSLLMDALRTLLRSNRTGFHVFPLLVVDVQGVLP